jgi:hypothetical protein
MTMTKTWFQLKAPSDLLEKLKVDCARLQAEPADSYAAFDFFVTAWHLVDWLHPGNPGKADRKALLARSSLLAVCQHVANVVKHLELNDPNLTSVSDAGAEGTFDRTFDFTFDRVRLVLRLDGQARVELGHTVDVSELAPLVVAWWETELARVP